MGKLKIYACLDCNNGKVVKGKEFKDLDTIGDPVKLAQKYFEQGADEIVFLDIFVTKEKSEINYELISEIKKNISIPLTIGGGINNCDKIEKLFDIGVDRVSINSFAIDYPEETKKIIRKYGKEKIVIAVDTMKVCDEYYVFKKNGNVQTNIKLIDWCKTWDEMGINALLVTSIKRDGKRNGYDIELYNLLSEFKTPIIASGGCGSVNDIYELITLSKCTSVLVASLFHYNLITPNEIKKQIFEMKEKRKKWLKVMNFNDNKLIPAIIQDYKNKDVLMLAYVNKESFSIMINEGRTCFYSRSRKKIWKKGETSGNVQIIKEIKYDCDADTLLIVVEQVGNACHLNKRSCFDDSYIMKDDAMLAFEPFKDINDIINIRKINPVDNSYTNYLLEKGIDKISKKLVEEAAETIIAAKNNNKKEIIKEISDLLYHLIVLMNCCDVNYNEICDELEKRSHISSNKKSDVN